MKRREEDIKRNKPVDMKELLRIMASPVKPEDRPIYFKPRKK